MMLKYFLVFVLGSLSFACSPAEPRAPAILALTPDVAVGAELYVDNCEECHQADGRGQGPGEDDLVVAVGEEPEEELIETILSGVERTRMAPFAAELSDQEIADIFGYVKTLAGK